MSWIDENSDNEENGEGEELGIVFEPDFDFERRALSENGHKKQTADSINHPEHYTNAPMECIEAIEGLQLPFHEAQILKYIVRWRHKNGIEDLKKALWYLNRLIETQEIECG